MNLITWIAVAVIVLFVIFVIAVSVYRRSMARIVIATVGGSGPYAAGETITGEVHLTADKAADNSGSKNRAHLL